jgi:hypothetical protein
MKRTETIRRSSRARGEDDCRGFPHSEQNFEPGGFSCPHLGQVITEQA